MKDILRFSDGAPIFREIRKILQSMDVLFNELSVSCAGERRGHEKDAMAWPDDKTLKNVMSSAQIWQIPWKAWEKTTAC